MIIPKTVVEIRGNTFYGQSFDLISIPDSVENIGWWALHAVKVRKLVLGGGIPDLNTHVFGWHNVSSMPCLFDIQELEMREGVTHLPECFWKQKNLKRVVCPRSLTMIPVKAFYYRPYIQNFCFDYLECGDPKELVMVVYRDSYAEEYAKGSGYTIEYRD